MELTDELKSKIYALYGKSEFAGKLLELDPDAISMMATNLSISNETIVSYIENGKIKDLEKMAQKNIEIFKLYKDLLDVYNRRSVVVDPVSIRKGK